MCVALAWPEGVGRNPTPCTPPPQRPERSPGTKAAWKGAVRGLRLGMTPPGHLAPPPQGQGATGLCTAPSLSAGPSSAPTRLHCCAEREGMEAASAAHAVAVHIARANDPTMLRRARVRPPCCGSLPKLPEPGRGVIFTNVLNQCFRGPQKFDKFCIASN